MPGKLVFAILCIGCFVSPLFADEIYLVNGDRISGTVKTTQDEKLIIISDLAGELKVDINNIATLKTNEPIEIQLKDGTGFKRQVEKADTGKFAIAGDETLKTQDFNVSAISAINPAAKEPPKWHGDISGALVSTHGNTGIDTRSLSVNLTKRAENDRSLFSTDYFYGKQKNQDTGEKEVTQDEWKMLGKYDYFFTKKVFGFLEGRYERDRIAELQRRVVIGAGAGYQWVESEAFNFSTGAGLASRYETYYNETPSSSELSLQLGYHLDKQLGKTYSFINDLTYYPSLEQFSDYYLTTTAELRAKVTELIFANFKVVFDYDATPANGKGNTDVKYILGVGVKF